MKMIEKKIDPAFFDAVATGAKKFELRLGDFEAQIGDTLRLGEYDRDSNTYTGRVIEKKITYVRHFNMDELWWTVDEIREHGLQILSIE
jgi:hypothetical protein